MQKLHDQVTDLNRRYGPDVLNYVEKVRSVLSGFVGDYADVPRYRTAMATAALSQAIQRAKKPLEVFEAIQATDATPSAMGEVFKQAAKAHRALDQLRLDVFEKLGQVEDEPRADVARMLRKQIQDALRADEHATALESIVGSWTNDSMKLLLDAPRGQTAQPVAQTPGGVELPIPLPQSPVTPGKMVTTGQRKITGKRAWQALREEIERELTEDAELELNWRIVKERPE
jgi:hypothetical protein